MIAVKKRFVVFRNVPEVPGLHAYDDVVVRGAMLCRQLPPELGRIPTKKLIELVGTCASFADKVDR